MQARNQIRAWMRRNLERFIDQCNEVDCTTMVETWDHETQSGYETLDTDHEAWAVAVEVADEYEHEPVRRAS